MSFDEAQVRRATDGKFAEKTGGEPEISLNDHIPGMSRARARTAVAGIAAAWGAENYDLHEPEAPGRDSYAEFFEYDGSSRYSVDIDSEGRVSRITYGGRPLDPESQTFRLADEGAADALGIPHLSDQERKRRQAENAEVQRMYRDRETAEYMDATAERYARVTELPDVDSAYKDIIRNADMQNFAPEEKALYLKAATIQAVRRTRELRVSGRKPRRSQLPESNPFRDEANRSEITERFTALADDPGLDTFERRMLFEQAIGRSTELDK